MEASIREGVDPALLMSIIRHTSSFDFNYEGSNREKGLLAIESGYGLEQIFAGAHRLKVVLDSVQNTEDAIAAFYPLRDMQGLNSEWRKNPSRSRWVREVLSDIPYYKNNGLK